MNVGIDEVMEVMAAKKILDEQDAPVEEVVKKLDSMEFFTAEPEIIQQWPPNIEEIRLFLPVTINNIFAYDRKIYSPGTHKLPPWLVEHEKVHFYQHELYGGCDRWWREFLDNPQFRLAEEIPAHQMEWRTWLAHQPRPRNHRRVTLKQMAKRLSAPMYGNIITFSEAKKAIRSGT